MRNYVGIYITYILKFFITNLNIFFCISLVKFELSRRNNKSYVGSALYSCIIRIEKPGVVFI